MPHFTTEDWIDFVNQVPNAAKKSEMASHLEKGCKACYEAASLWLRVRSTADSVNKYQAPESTVRLAKAAFAGSKLRWQADRSANAVELLFDSFLRPALQGARAAGESGTRQMLYRADPYQIDLHIEARPGANRLVVIGQLLDMRKPDVPGRAVPVTISNLRGNVIHTVTNEFGEFREEIQPSGDLELTVTGENEQAIIISLRDALGRLPEGIH
jgi:hypothetical protein